MCVSVCILQMQMCVCVCAKRKQSKVKLKVWCQFCISMDLEEKCTACVYVRNCLRNKKLRNIFFSFENCVCVKCDFG